ncbi:MAG: hypothetical protein MK171_05555 [Pirellulales bacterium]|nr:hypothetical protein [Pirellulales bacterium]
MEWLLLARSRFATARCVIRARVFCVCLTSLIAIQVFPSSSDAETQFPYVAYVSANGTYARSGPGQRYYPTRRLPQSFAVEVYRHDDPGWCAVRPTEQSFSWIAAHQVRRVNREVAEIIVDQVVARVGSSLSPARSAVQVMVPKGERVAVLPAHADDDPHWLRIVAPAGEFRWVAADDLSLSPPLESHSVRPPGQGWRHAQGTKLQNGASQTDSSLQVGLAPDSEPDKFDHLQSAAPDAASATARTELQAAPPYVLPAPQNSDSVDVIAGSPVDMLLGQHQAQSTGLATPPLAGTKSPSGDIESSVQGDPAGSLSRAPRIRLPGLTASLGKKSQNVAELELLLSQMVARPPQSWDLAPLHVETLALVDLAESTAERVQLRELASRIDRFRRVAQQYQHTTRPASGSLAAQGRDPFAYSPNSPVDSLPTHPAYADEGASRFSGLVENVRQRVQEDLGGSRRVANAATGPAGSGGAAQNSLFDAVGRLKPVVSQREQAPPYALVDDKGQVTSFITPTPDLNLQPYVGRQIGVHGNRGFIPEYRKAHVTAGRVSPIETRVR